MEIKPYVQNNFRRVFTSSGFLYENGGEQDPRPCQVLGVCVRATGGLTAGEVHLHDSPKPFDDNDDETLVLGLSPERNRWTALIGIHYLFQRGLYVQFVNNIERAIVHFEWL